MGNCLSSKKVIVNRQQQPQGRSIHKGLQPTAIQITESNQIQENKHINIQDEATNQYFSLQKPDRLNYESNQKIVVINSRRSSKRQETDRKSQIKKEPDRQFISLKPEQKDSSAKPSKIYEITLKFPIQKPYSTSSEFQKILLKYRQYQQSTTNETRQIKNDYVKLAQQILELRDRNWIQDLIVLHQNYINGIHNNSFDSLTQQKRILQLREQFNWQVWAMGQIFFENREMKGIPKQSLLLWNEGFSFKGVWYRLLPIYDCQHILNEMRGLKQVNLELMDLLQGSSVNRHQASLAKQIIIPLIATVKCGGFLLYGTPLIYTQEMPQKSHRKRETESFIDQNQEFNQFELPRVSSMTAAVNNTNVNHLLSARKESFSYLHKNIEERKFDDQILESMPTLKNITAQNLVPVIDFESLNQNIDTTDLQINYLAVYTWQCLQQLSSETTCCHLFSIPVFSQEEIMFHPFPTDFNLDLEVLKGFFYQKSNAHVGDNPLPRGDTGDSSPKQPTILKCETPIKEQELNIKTKYMTKHGWKLMILENQGTPFKASENRRASHLFGLKEAQKVTVQNKKVFSPSKENLQESMTEIYLTGDDQLYGHCIVSAKYQKGLKIQSSLTHHNYEHGIEIMLSICLKNVVKTLEENPARYYNEKGLKELMHRKGLNLRFIWLVLAKLTNKKARELVMIVIMLRIMKKVVNQKIKLKSYVQKQVNLIAQVSVTGLKGVDSQQDQYMYSSDHFRESICIFINATIKNKYAKYKSTFDETLSGMFFHRCKAISLAQILDMKLCELNYLESKDILDHVLESPSKSPTLFLNSVQTFFGFQFTPEFQRQYRQDSYALVNRNQPVTSNDFRQIDLKIESVFSLRELSYFILARQINHNKKTQNQRNGADRDQLSRVFNKSVTKQGASAVRQQNQPLDTQRSFDTNRNKPDSRIDTQRQFKNLGSGSNSSYQNIIDLSRQRKPLLPSIELIMPASLYKLKPQNVDHQIFQPYYEVPSIDTLNEWVMILDSLIKDVFSILNDNADQSLLESLVYQTLVQMLQEDDVESSFKILQKIRDQLFESILVSPELVSTIMMITGLYNDMSSEMIESFPSESEKYYVASLVQLMQITGDPRGRGNYGCPIILFLTWKLQLLALTNKKVQDSEVAEEIFDACLQGVQKKQFKIQILEAVQAQEKAYKDSERSQIVQSNNHETDLTSLFNLAKYKKRPKNVLNAGGFVKPTAAYQFRESNQKKTPQKNNISQFLKSNVDIDISDIDVTIRLEDEEAIQQLIELNFKYPNTDEQTRVPFQHWMINRQVYAQILLSLKKEKDKDQKDMLTHLLRQTLNSIQPQALLQWLIQYLPIQMQSGQSWESQTIKEFVFSQNAVLSHNGSSTFSHSGMSQRSHKSDVPENSLSKSKNKNEQNTFEAPKQKKVYLGSYTQLFGREYGGINKSDIQGLLYVWGTDNYGQLGLDHYCPNQKSQQGALKLIHPRLCIPLKDEVLKEVCCGYAFTFAINQHGQTYSWGSNEYGQLGLGSDFMNIQTVRCPQINSYLQSVQKISAGNEHGLALIKTGEVYSWGSANLTGFDDITNRHVPTQIEMFSQLKAVQVACGGLHSCVVTKSGEIYSWGSNEGGQLGLDSKHALEECVKTPQLIQSLSKVKQFVVEVACGETHCIALTKEGKVWGWGMSMYGQLGLGFSADSFQPGIGLSRSKVPVPTELTPHLPPYVSIVKVICGAAFTLLQTKEGELYGCGINDLGQLGLDTYLEEMQYLALERARLKNGATQTSSDVTMPSKVICFEKMNVHSVACGENHSLAVIGEEKNMLWSWGMYKQGQLGLGEINTKMNPRPVQTLCSSHIHRIAAGSMHSVALLGEEK